MTHTWNIERVQYHLANGRISHLHWRLVSTDGTNTVESHGSVKLKYAINDPVQVPFANVTVAIAREWLTEKLGEAQSQLTERHVARLAEKASATTAIVPLN